MSQFVKEDAGGLIKIKCPAVLDMTAAQEFSDQAKTWMLSATAQFVLDMEGVVTITREFYRSVIQLKTTLKRDEKILYTVNIGPKLARQLKDDGVEAAFNLIASVDALAKAKASRSSGSALNVAVVNPFVTAAQKTIEVQCKTPVKLNKPYIKKEPAPNIAIASVISLNSNEFTGSVAICFSEPVFLRIYENMFDEKHPAISPEIQDAAGEMLNIIYGLAKIELNRKGYNFQKAIPTVLVGEKLKIRHMGAKPAVVIPFDTDAGAFHLEIEFDLTVEGSNV